MFERSDSIKEISEALKQFQSEMEPVIKKAKNPYYKSKYADLPGIIEASKQLLVKNNLSFSQIPVGDGGLYTILMHKSGEWIGGSFTMSPVDKKPQTYGSMITYMRRYALGAILGIATEEDDDGNEASKPTKKSKLSRAEYEDTHDPFKDED